MVFGLRFLVAAAGALDAPVNRATDRRIPKTEYRK